MPTDKEREALEPELPELLIPEAGAPNVQLQPSGSVIHDGVGSASWTLIGDGATTASGILKYLDASDLKVEGQSVRSVTARGGSAPTPDRGGGYDPYNQAPSRSGPALPTKSRGARR